MPFKRVKLFSEDRLISVATPGSRKCLGSLHVRNRGAVWVDRLTCAWLIRRFIDVDAQFIWLDSPSDCPSDAPGFDFDGARFSHVGQRVSFETLIESFAVQQPGLARLAGVIHYLDVGGNQPSEAPGIERVLAGLRESIGDDDQLTMVAGGIFDGLLTAFASEEAPNG